MFKKICPHCNTTLIPVQDRYCDECQSKVDVISKQSYKDYKLHRTDTKEQEFYLCKDWKRVRLKVLQQYHNIDIYQYYINHTLRYCDMVHHIIEVKDDWSMRLDIDNLIPLSNETHIRIGNLYISNKTHTQQLLRELTYRWNEEFKK